MSDHSSYTLHDCGCRESPDSAAAPRNLPGQAEIRHRPDDYEGFRKAMLQRLQGDPRFRALTTRDPTDTFMALLDAGAATAEMVAFYQDRWANQHYLGTASEPGAIEDLAAQIGYQPSPALGSETVLAYTLTDAPGSPDPVKIPAGAAAMSQPEDDGQPQFFATSDDLEARIAWNRIPARLVGSQPLSQGTDTLFLAGTALNLKPGDRLLIQRAELGQPDAHHVARLAAVVEDATAQRTTATLLEALPASFSRAPAAGFPRVFAFRLTAAPFGATAPDWRALPASLKREVLGLEENAEIPDDQKVEWPHFHIHLPTEGVLGASQALAYTKASTPESLAQAIKQTVGQRADTAMKSAQSEMASLGFSGVTSGIALLDTVAQGAHTLFNASTEALADTAAAAGNLPAQTNILLTKVFTALQGLFRFDVEIPDFDPGDDNEGALAKLTRFLTQLGGGFEVTPGNLDLSSLLQDEVTEILRATPFGWPLRLGELLQETVPGTNETRAERIAARAGVSLERVEEAFGRVGRTLKANIELALATQAKVVTEAAVDAALQMTPPEQFGDRRAFLAFVGTTSARFLSLPWRVNSPDELLAALQTPGEIDPDGMPALFRPEKFAPNTYRAADFKDQAVTGSEVAVLGTAVGFLPSAVAVPMIGFSAFADLLSGDEAETYALRLQDEVVETIEKAMGPQTGTLSSLAALAANYDPATLSLDAAYPVIVPGSKVLLGLGGAYTPFEVVSSEQQARADFGLSGKSTILTLNPADLSAYHDAVRDLVVLGQSEELTLGDRPLEHPVEGSLVEVPPDLPVLPPGRELVLAGVPADSPPAVEERHRVTVEEHIPGPAAHLHLRAPLPGRFNRKSVFLLGNVVAARQGQAGFEILGSGDPGISFASFTLKQSPITHYPSATAEAIEQSLTVEVDGRAWTHVRTLFGQPPGAHVYTTRSDPDGRLTIQFGDGATGARPPRGANNIVARYRVGAGTTGNVSADLIKAPLDLPAGVQAVTNPLPATGGTNRQDPARTRAVAPLPTRALGRIVSRRDYESWALAYPGIAKALAETVWHAGRETLVLTIVGDEGARIEAGTPLHDSFVAALAAARHGRTPFAVAPHRDLRFRLRARLAPAEGFTFAVAAAAACELLNPAFAFEARGLGQAVFASDLVSRLQAHPTIAGVDLDVLMYSHTGFAFERLRPVLLAAGARSVPSGLWGATLLTLAETPDALAFEPLLPA